MGIDFLPAQFAFRTDLIRQARETFYWSDAPVLGTPQRVAEAARAARDHRVSGFIPSLEAFSYVAQHSEGGEEWVKGRRMKPFGLDSLAEGKMPYNALLVRVQRFAVTEFSKTPGLNPSEFETKLSDHIFGAQSAAVKDLLELQRIWTFESEWYWSSPLLDPEFFSQRARRLKWPKEKLVEYDKNLESLKQIAATYAISRQATEMEMAKLAGEVVQRWGTNTPTTISNVRE